MNKVNPATFCIIMYHYLKLVDIFTILIKILNTFILLWSFQFLIFFATEPN